MKRQIMKSLSIHLWLLYTIYVANHGTQLPLHFCAIFIPAGPG